jgi:hypothetical protein
MPKKVVKPGPKLNASAAAKSADNVSDLLKSVQKFVEDVYALRHAKPSASDPTPTMAPPVKHGGTFKEILQRAWSDPVPLLTDSHNMLIAAQIMPPTSTIDDFGETYLNLKVSPT